MPVNSGFHSSSSARRIRGCSFAGGVQRRARAARSSSADRSSPSLSRAAPCIDQRRIISVVTEPPSPVRTLGHVSGNFKRLCWRVGASGRGAHLRNHPRSRRSPSVLGRGWFRGSPLDRPEKPSGVSDGPTSGSAGHRPAAARVAGTSRGGTRTFNRQPRQSFTATAISASASAANKRVTRYPRSRRARPGAGSGPSPLRRRAGR